MFTHSVNCPCCGESFSEDWSDYVIDSSVVDEDRGMGAETEHEIECDDFDCPHCSAQLSIRGSVWEYPVGVYNHHEINAEAINADDDDEDI